MLQLNEIQAIVDQVMPTYKKTVSKIKDKKAACPDYHSTYAISVSMLEDISIHSIKGIKPEKLIAERAPYQSQEEFDYVIKNYKQISLPIYGDFISTFSRCFADSSWSITYPAYTDEDNLKAYLDEGLKQTPIGMSAETWWRTMYPPIKMRDSQGCIAMRPWFIPTTEEGGETVISSERFEPIPFYFDSRRVLQYKENEYYLFLSPEKSSVTFNDKPVNEGIIFEFYDDVAVWRITQVGRKIDYVFQYDIFYEHGRGKVPVTRLKGNPFYHEQELVWASPFLDAVDILDEAILDNNNLRAIKNKCVYPVRVMVSQTCNNTMTVDGVLLACNGGYFHDVANNSQIKCSVCNGTGKLPRLGPYGDILLDSETAFKEGEASNGKAIYYAEPTPEMPKLLRDELERSLNIARGILHLKTTNTEAQPSEGTTPTATGQQIDQKAMYAYLSTPRNQAFEFYGWLIDWTAYIRYGEGYEVPVISVSDSFDMKTDQDYLTEIATAIDAGIPQVVVNQLTKKYLDSLFYNEGSEGKIAKIIIEADRLLTLPADEIPLRVSSGLINKWEVILHDSGIQLLRELIRSNPNFLGLEIAEQVSQLTALAQTKAGEIQTAIQTQGNGQPTTLDALRTRLGITTPPTTPTA